VAIGGCSRKARKLALATENRQAQGLRMNPDEEQFSGNRDSVKGNSYHLALGNR
jgi:hypothetical protein